ERITRITEAQGQIAAAKAQMARIAAPSDAQMRQLREALKREADLRLKLELARVSVTFIPSEALELTVLAGENPGTFACVPESAISLSGTPNLSFAIEGVGQFEVNGPATNYNKLKEDLEKERLAISELQSQFQTTDPDALEARRQEKSQVDSEIRQATRAVS
ncbi:MAG: hypothetical protein ACRD4O_18355, partial [Bryobacteraceae bacterium]